MIKEALGDLFGRITGAGKDMEVKAKVFLMKKNVLDLTDFKASLLDGLTDFLGEAVSFQLVSSTVGDWNNGNRGIVGEAAYLDHTIFRLPMLIDGESEFGLSFKYSDSDGIPGAVIVKNNHQDEFFLKSITIENFPGKGRIHFDCSSWVYNVSKYNYDRIFFSNDVYLPNNTPKPLIPYRQEELLHLRGDNVSRTLEEWDRVYNYAYYNDLGNPDKDIIRPILGGSKAYPYPRRGKTGRPPTKKDPKSESRLSNSGLNIYVPRDERFGHLKMSDFLGYSLRSLALSSVPKLQAALRDNEFESFDNVMELFEGGLPVNKIPLSDWLNENDPFHLIKALFSTSHGQQVLKFPLPEILKDNKYAWKTDEEFGREMLAGVNPVIIQRLQEFPPTSTLDPVQYGNQISSITEADIDKNLEGLTVTQALTSNRLYILDHHDSIMPYLKRINSNTPNRIYATRTVLLLKDNGVLKPLAIEVSVPHPDGEQRGKLSKVITPSDIGVEGTVWQLAKTYVSTNDYGVHQLRSHWLNTHASIEPFILATNRHLSAMHPINKLLMPHYRDTMNINALARQSLINGGGIIEQIVFPAKYSMEMSSAIYKSWNFTEQGLEADLLKRGVAVEDKTSPNNIRLLIDDYPYAVDGLEIWSAIKTWVNEYCSIYYPDDNVVKSDVEVQAWWKEIREVGHGDHKDAPWWPLMQSVSDLTQACTTVIWCASALHAAVNFGQYTYSAYPPNRPTTSRRLLPEQGTPDYQRLQTEPEKMIMETISNELQSVTGMATVQILSTHATDEVYLGQQESAEWTSDGKALDAFNKFGHELGEVEKRINQRNKDSSLKNRTGLVNLPYTLLFPSSNAGMTGKGIPNSVSI